MHSQITWKELVSEVLQQLGGEASLYDIYGLLENHPRRPQTATWRATVRRVLRQYKVFEPFLSSKGKAAYRYVAPTPLQFPTAANMGFDPHGEQQGMLLQLGRICGYETFTNATDRTIRKMGAIPISQFASVRNDREGLRNLPLDRIRNTDVLWLSEDDQGLYPRYAFEVEETTKVKNGLLRLLKIPLRYGTMLYVIGRSAKESELFNRYMAHSPFREHAERMRFRYYDDVTGFYTHALAFDGTLERFGVALNMGRGHGIPSPS